MIHPSKIVCVGRNYVEHAKELGNEVPKEPLIFLKPPSSLIDDGQPIHLTNMSKQVEFEGEIGIIIGTRLTRADQHAAQAAIQAIAAVNDVTARDLQKSDSQWTRAKGFDTFCPVGVPTQGAMAGAPWCAYFASWVANQAGVPLGDQGQGFGSVDQLYAWAQRNGRAYTAGSGQQPKPGDLVCTGTPAGVGTLQPGDVVEVEVLGVSRVRNPVAAAR